MDHPTPNPTNGTAKQALVEARRRRLLLEEQLKAKRLQRLHKLHESLALDDDFDTDIWRTLRYVDRVRYLPHPSPSDRRAGADRLLFETEQELDDLRQRSRGLWAGNSYAKALLRNLTNYVIGKGFSYKAQAKRLQDLAPDVPGAQQPAGLPRLVRQVQDVVDDFCRLNRWNGSADPRGSLSVAGTREREAFRRVKRDGEAFLRFYRTEEGKVFVRFVEPEQVRDPAGALEQDGWSFGIRHRMEPFEDVEAAEEYYVWWQNQVAHAGEVGEYVDAEDVLHLKGPDTDAAVKRGLPEFVYDTARALERAAKLQKNLSAGAAIRAATAEIWQHATGTEAQISALADQFKEYERTDPITGNTETVERIGPGAIRRIPAGQELVGQPEDQTASYLQGVRGDLMQACGPFCAPEYWTGDASNANYSSLESASAPPVKNGETEQEYFKSAYCRAVWVAVEWAVECGLLPDEALSLVEIQVEAPQVLHRNELDTAMANEIRVTAGWKSRQTVAMEEGLDPELEQANNEEWAAKNASPAAPAAPIPPDPLAPPSVTPPDPPAAVAP
jgi:capsid protein